MSVKYSGFKILLDSGNLNEYVTRINDSNSSFTFRLKTPIILDNHDPHVIAISVESASIPLSYYSINSFNNRFSLKINSESYDFVIPPGNYRINQLIITLNNLLQKQSITIITFDFDIITSKITVITNTSDLNLVFKDSVDSETSAVLGYTSSDDTLPAPSTSTTDGVTTFQYEFEDVVNLVYTTGVQISLENVVIHDNRTLLRIPITTPPNTILQYMNTQPFLSVIKDRHLTSLSISLLDDKNQLLRINGNHPWIIVIRVSYIIQDSITLIPSRVSKQRLEQEISEREALLAKSSKAKDKDSK